MTRDCQQIRELMDSYLAGELLVETNHTILRHVESCAECAAELERRQTLRTLLKQGVAADVGVAPLRRKIQAAIAREPRRSTTAIRVAVAAAVVLAIVVYGWPRPRVEAALYRDAVVNHIECALTRPASMTFSADRAARRLRVPFAGLSAIAAAQYSAFRLIDAHTCPYLGHEYAHLVFRRGTETMSVFVDPGAGRPMPAGDADLALTAPPTTVEEARYRGFEAAGAATRAHQIVVVSELPRTDHLALVRLVLPDIWTSIQTMER